MGYGHYPEPLSERLLDGLPAPVHEPPLGWGPPTRWRKRLGRLRGLPFNLLLFLLTILTTLIVGTHIARNYARGLPTFDWEFSQAFFSSLWRHPSQLWFGWPFCLALLSILLAHELGHYFTCRHHGIRASYPYFIPAPTLIGTLGAFIRIKSPIVTRRALFDVGISGPLVGFAVALPALALAILHSRASVPPNSPDTITLGNPLAVILLAKLLRPGINPASISLHPVGCAAWVGLFATTLNLLPAGQLDGGHILYAVLGDKHRTVSRGLFLALVPMGVFCWPGWMVWAAILLVLGLRHPVVMRPCAPLDTGRKLLALIAVLIFVLTFIPTPFSVR
jgi:membrane-associated protease RseP (regulator of RpoE activity)